MRKVKVKILDSIAGLKDPRSPSELDEKYRQQIQRMNKGRQKPFSEGFVEELVSDFKKHDRYGEKPLGFARDWSFKPGDEVMINADLAEKWQDAGICTILADEPAAKKAA